MTLAESEIQGRRSILRDTPPFGLGSAVTKRSTSMELYPKVTASNRVAEFPRTNDAGDSGECDADHFS